jgi:DNA-binding response OmpR family regulator
LLKRYRIAYEPVIQIGEVRIDCRDFEVRIRDEKLRLPLKEFELLFKMASYPNRTFTRTQFIEQIWGIDYEGDERTVDVHIKRLRQRFAGLTGAFQIVTIRGLGYRLEVNP